MSDLGDVHVEMQDLVATCPPLAFGQVSPVHISVKDLNVRTKQSRVLLEDISMQIPAGTLMAIMGGSGSGKTTLLNVLAGRAHGLSISGQIMFNQRPAKEFILKRALSYVEQTDRLLPYLTVRDTLRYAAQLRLPQSLSKKEKFALVEEVIQELGLKECSDTIVGDEWRKGISGGEKRRVSVGVQLLTNPSVIVLDEPTTGLDAFSAHSLVETLVSLSKRGRTVILSIHQPRSDIFNLFVSLTLLTKGRLAYTGSQSSVLAYFEGLDYPIKENVNGADFLIDITTVDNHNEEIAALSKSRVDKIVDAWKSRVVSVPSYEPARNSESMAFFFAKGPRFLNQTSVLIRRSFTNMKQDRLTLIGSVAEVICLSLALGWMYFQLPDSPQGIMSRKSSLYSVCALHNYLSLMFMIFKLSNEMVIFDRERADRMYSVPAYILSWFVVNSGFYAALSVVFSAVVYFMVGLRSDDLALHFGIFCLCVTALQFVTISYAFACISINRNFAIASLIGNALFTFISMSSGFFIAVDAIPVYLRWFQHVGYVTYGLRILSTNEFEDKVFPCAQTPEGRYLCVGNNIIRQLGFTPQIAVPFIGLLSIFSVFILLTLLILHFFPKNISKQANVYSSSSLEKLKSRTAVIVEKKVHPILIRVENYSLSLVNKKTNMTSRKSSFNSVILDSVNATFMPGQLTAVLGASGSGKTTLLHLLHARYPNFGSFVELDQSGEILHNGRNLAQKDVACITASVRQEDSHLLPALTARETLQYAAQLKLSQISKHAAFAKVEEIISELRLTDCANTAVGGAKIKGLSGGEKRRVSVGLAMLTDPAVLLLDEPTSGLDAATAKNVMLTLKAVAASGRTVICTVHQPRSDIVHLFDSALLMARGGHVVFQGSVDNMLRHFTSLDLRMPKFTNPADFAIDVTSVDLRNQSSETLSKTRLERIVEAWQKPIDRRDSSQLEDPEKIIASHSIHFVSTVRALPLLMSRSFRNLSRQIDIMFSRIMQMVTLGLIFAAYFAPISSSQESITSRIGILQQTGSLVFIGMLNCIAVFPQELKLFKFEFQDRMYSVQSFFLTYTLNELPFEIIGSVLWAVILIYAIGLKINFSVCMFAGFALVNAGESIGIAFCSFLSEPGFSVQIMSAILSIMSIMAGYLSLDMPKILDILNYASINRHIARLQGIQEFSGLRFDCPNPLLCQYESGEQVLTLLGFDKHNAVQEAWIGVVLCLVFCKLLTLILQWFNDLCLDRTMSYFILKKTLS